MTKPDITKQPDPTPASKVADGEGSGESACSVVFLDFDGVIRLAFHSPAKGLYGGIFIPEKMEMLRCAVLRCGAKLVISSDWRNMENREEIQKMLEPHLNDLLHPDWATPISGHRWNQVQAWLVSHPEVTDYAILEDFAPHFEGCPTEMRERLLLCSNRHGIVPNIMARMETILTQNS